MKKKYTAMLTAALLAVSLTGCENADYKKANELMNSGSYDEAMTAFEELGNYKDSAELAKECKYLYADAVFKSGDYLTAAAAFNEISDYKDSLNKFIECGYKAAVGLYEAGDYTTALPLFHSLGSYEDAENYATEAAWKLLKSYYYNPDVEATYDRKNGSATDVLTVNCEKDGELELTFSYWYGKYDSDSGERGYDNFLSLTINKGSDKARLSGLHGTEPYYFCSAEINLSGFTPDSKAEWDTSDASPFMDNSLADLISCTAEEFEKSNLGITLSDIGFKNYGS